MFKSTLLGTPRNTHHRSLLEFTPIGRASHAINEDSDKENAPQGPRDINRGKLHQFTNYDTTEEFSTIGDSPYKPLNLQKPTNTQVQVHEQHEPELVNNGMTSIKEQQQHIQKLNTENYNLKLEIKALRHYLNQIPEDQRRIFDINIKLEQKLAASAKQIDTLNEQVYHLKSSAEQNSDAQYEEMLRGQETQFERERADRIAETSHFKARLAEAESENAEFHAKIDSLEEQIGHYQHKIQELEIQNRHTHEAHQLESLDAADLKHELSAVSNELSAANKQLSMVTKELADVSDEAESLKHTNKLLKQQLELTHSAESHSNGLQDKISDLQLEVEHWQARCDTMESEFRKLHDSKHDSLSGARDEILALKAEIEDLKYANQNTSAQLDRSRKEVESLLQNLSSDSQKLGAKLSQMSLELREHERNESNLRAQINALIREKSEGSKASHGVYEAQIRQLTQSESQLAELNKKLTLQIAELKDEIYHLTSTSSGFDSRLMSLQRQNKELQEKLDFYEHEFATVEDAYKNSDKDQKHLKRNLEQLSSDYDALKSENEVLQSQIKAQNYSSSAAISELEKFKLKQLESENEQLQLELERLNADTAKLKRELDFEKHNNHSEELEHEVRKLRRELELTTDPVQVEQLQNEVRRLKNQLEYERKQPSTPEYRPITPNSSVYLENECHRLHLEKDLLVTNLRDIEHKYRNLQTSLVDKEDLLDRMEIQIKELRRASKSSYSVDEDAKTELVKAKVANESRIRQLEIEKESIQKDYEFQIQHYKTRIEDLLSKQKDDNTDSVVTLLEKQIDEAYKAKNELNQQLVQTTKEKEQFEKDISQLQTSASTYEQNEKLLRLENDQLELKNKTVETELEKVTQHCQKLVSKLNEYKYKSGSDKLSSQFYQRQIDDLQVKLSQAAISPTPSRNVFQEEQLKYYRAKLHDLNMRANDFEFMYNFVIQSAKNSGGALKSDLSKLAMLGIYPDRPQNKKPLTFAVVAKFVLALVRMKKRQEKADTRRRVIADIKSSIDKKKKIMG